MANAAFRALGPRNANLPEATSQVIGFFHDPDKWPYMKYTQLIGLDNDTNGLYRYAIIEPDEPLRLTSYNKHAWGFDDELPAGEDFNPRVVWESGQTLRYGFGYRLGQRTQKAWTNSTNLNPQSLYDKMRLNHAQLHRASRAVDNVRGATFATYNTSTLAALHGSPTPAVFWDKSSGTELTAAGNQNPNFQIIKKTVNIILRRLDLQTNGAVRGEEVIGIVGPKVAQRMSESGEVVNFLKQQTGAKQDLMKRNSKWNIPDDMYGVAWVVEDTPRVFVKPMADQGGTGNAAFADATVSAGITPVGAVVAYNERDYIWNDDTVVFCSRAGGLDGGYGFQNFSTFQMYYYNELAQVKAETDSWNEILKGAIIIEDDFKAPALLSGFKLTSVLSSLPA